MQHLVGSSVVSLFAGIGGFDLGFQRAGFKIVAHVEKDANCRKLLAAKWPDAITLADVCEAGAHNLPPCDVVTFGFPCQDLSVAGKRAGLAGGRSGLFYEAMRLIDELRPAFALFENVPGLLSSDKGRDFARVLMEMDRIGYNGAWRVLDAQWFGVAQRRRRVFGLFSRLDSGAERCAEILSLPESLRGHLAPSREAGQVVAGCLESRTGGGGFPGTDGACAGHVIPAVARTVSCNTARKGIPSTNGLDGALIPAVARSLNAGRDGYNDGSDQTYIPAVAGCLQNRDAKGTDSKTKPGHLVPCVAVPTQVQWASGGGMLVRRLTPTECERLQGFPDGWTAGFSDSTRYKMLGNAVCVNVAEWIAGRLAKEA